MPETEQQLRDKVAGLETEAQNARDQVETIRGQLLETQAELGRERDETARLRGLNEDLCKQCDDHRRGLAVLHTERERDAQKLRDADRQQRLREARGS